MRLAGPAIKEAFIKGILDEGSDIIDIGIVGSEVLYFASGFLKKAGAMITASHNPSDWIGMKFFGSEGDGIGLADGLDKIEEMIKTDTLKPAPKKKGNYKGLNIWSEYHAKVLSMIDMSALKPLKIVVDAGNGIGGVLVNEIFADLPFEIVPLYFEPNGNFPHHQPSPIESKNLVDVKQKVIDEKADLGVALDGDGDRIFFIDETGELIQSSKILALITQKILASNPGSKIVYAAVASNIIPETIKQSGGEPIIEKVGHTFLKQRMKLENAIFGGEPSGHYYYTKFWNCESSMVTLLTVLEMMCKKSKKISELVKQFDKYFMIEETNYLVDDKDAMIKKLAEHYSGENQSMLDGLTVRFDDWWFNVRPSNTEPLLRLNVEAKTKKLMDEKKKEVENLITQN